MSSHFTIYCETCEEPGPHIRRHHDGGVLLAQDTPRFFPRNDADLARKDWGAFLIEHEYHELRLIHEYGRTMKQVEQAAQREAAMQPRFRLMPDGSLEAL